MTQGNPLAILVYGIGVLFLIMELRGAHPRVTHPWYADDAGAGGKFPNIIEHLRYLQVQGPARGYYLDLTRSILVMAPGNVVQSKAHFRGLGFRVVTGHCYLG